MGHAWLLQLNLHDRLSPSLAPAACRVLLNPGAGSPAAQRRSESVTPGAGAGLQTLSLGGQ